MKSQCENQNDTILDFKLNHRNLLIGKTHNLSIMNTHFNNTPSQLATDVSSTHQLFQKTHLEIRKNMCLSEKTKTPQYFMLDATTVIP